MEWVIGIIILITITGYIAHISHKQRVEMLMAKYKDAEIVRRILQKILWQGETVEQVKDSFGDPVDLDRKVYKTKTKEVWKYNPTGKNRFALKITIEDNLVVGWEIK